MGVAPAVADRMSSCRKYVSPDALVMACSDVIDQQPAVDVLVEAWTFRGKAYARKGMSKEAAENYSEAIRVGPRKPAAWIGRGMARLLERRFDDAVRDYSTAIGLKPDDASIYLNRGYVFLAQGKPKMAIEDFSKVLELAPDSAIALNNRGLAYRKLNQNDRALEDYTAAIRVSPLYALAYNNRGYVHEAIGKKSKAIEDFRNALALDPSLLPARNGLVRLSAASNLAEQSAKRAAQGEAIAKTSCAWCHAIGRKGDSPHADAPPFRDIHANHPILALRRPITRAIATPHDKMPKIPLSNDQVDEMIAYINSLQSN